MILLRFFLLFVLSYFNSNLGTPFSGFKGCIKEPRLNNQPLPFSGTNDIVSSVDARKVKPECRDSGRCSDQNCPRFSVCMNTLSKFKCHCLTGHYGMCLFTLFSFTDGFRQFELSTNPETIGRMTLWTYQGTVCYTKEHAALLHPS